MFSNKTLVSGGVALVTIVYFFRVMVVKIKKIIFRLTQHYTKNLIILG
jgi:hypothetical protein